MSAGYVVAKASAVFNTGNTILLNSAYDKVEIFGQNTGAGFQNIWGTNGLVTLAMYNDYVANGYNPYWDDNTYLLANFVDGLNAGNVAGYDGTLKGWSLYRQLSGSTIQDFIKDFDSETKFYRDYNVEKNNLYKYVLHMQLQNKVLTIDNDSYVKNVYEGHYLIDVDNDVAYKINILTSDDGKTLNRNFTKYETNTELPIFSVGKSKYISGGVGGLLVTDNTDVNTNTIKLLQQFREFISSNRIKYLKNKKGEVFVVFIDSYSENVVEQGIAQQPYICKFTFTEIDKTRQVFDIIDSGTVTVTIDNDILALINDKQDKIDPQITIAGGVVVDAINGLTDIETVNYGV